MPRVEGQRHAPFAKNKNAKSAAPRTSTASTPRQLQLQARGEGSATRLEERLTGSASRRGPWGTRQIAGLLAQSESRSLGIGTTQRIRLRSPRERAAPSEANQRPRPKGWPARRPESIFGERGCGELKRERRCASDLHHWTDEVSRM